MSWGIIVFFILIGIVALILEIFVIPGFGVVGIFGFSSLIFGIYEAYYQYGTIAGNITLISTILFLLILIVISLRTKTWRKLMLNTNIDSKVNEIDEHKVEIGTEGITISRLAPSGKARLNDEIFEVDTQGLFVDPNTEIVVIKINKNKIIVKPKN